MPDKIKSETQQTKNNLPQTLLWRDAFLFPVSTEEARLEIVLGGLLVLALPPFGWVINLGNRLNVVRRLYRGQACFTKFRPFIECFTRGAISAATIISYLFPGMAVLSISGVCAFLNVASLPVVIALTATGIMLFSLGMFILPGCMVIYACEDTPEILLRPDKALIRSIRRGRIFLKAWLIAISAIALSFLGLAFFGVGFFFASVWAWQVAGYAFTIGIYGTGSNNYESLK